MTNQRTSVKVLPLFVVFSRPLYDDAKTAWGSPPIGVIAGETSSSWDMVGKESSAPSATREKRSVPTSAGRTCGRSSAPSIANKKRLRGKKRLDFDEGGGKGG